ncbi:cyanase [Corynebacterium bovis]|uniref:cyanase n=1 Tax=Corynebacterium bovis TaxID=36808 RepID=UPI003139FA43
MTASDDTAPTASARPTPGPLPDPILDRGTAGRLIDSARIRHGLTWRDIAAAVDRPLVWTTSACLGSFPVELAVADRICALLELPPEVAESLRTQPTRVRDDALLTDPTIYRLTEAIQVHGAAIKALIHEEFGDGIMSAINFTLDIDRREDPDGDRVVITMDGKFLDYRW